MLDSLNESLQRVQVIDQKTLLAALGNVSGSRVSETARAFTLQGGMRPELSMGSSTTNVQGANPSTSETTTDSSKSPSQLPAIPWNFDLLTSPQSSLGMGLNAGDLLNDQVNLTYQIFNLRMILDRALSDRLNLTTGFPAGGWSPRLQAVLGLNVSVVPERDHIDSAAVVRIRLTLVRKDHVGRTTQIATDRPNASLVAMMPLERTYNASALSSKSNAFGASAVAKMITVGYSERRRGANLLPVP
jgi:hypothetical protein